MTKNILQNKILEIEKSLMERKPDNWGFPVGAIIFNEKGRTECLALNAKGTGEKTNPTKHAEHMMLDNYAKNIDDKYLLITLPPCQTCLNIIIERGMFKKIYVMFDPRNKKEQEQYKNIKNKVVYLDAFKTQVSWSLLKARMYHGTHRGSLLNLLSKQDSEVLLPFIKNKKEDS